MKDTKGKLPYNLIDPYFYEDLAKVLQFGTIKYGPSNWKSEDPKKFIPAAERHLQAIKRGEVFDKETNLPHASHLGCNAMFLHHEAMHGTTYIPRYTDNGSETHRKPRRFSEESLRPDSEEADLSAIELKRTLEQRIAEIFSNCRTWECSGTRLVDILSTECIKIFASSDYKA
jgi:hypothetical protein